MNFEVILVSDKKWMGHLNKLYVNVACFHVCEFVGGMLLLNYVAIGSTFLNVNENAT